METGSHESHRTDPFEMLIEFADRLFVWDMPYVQTGVVMIVDGVEFTLPPFHLNELQGTAVYLPMTAPIVDALYSAQTLALRTPQGVVHDFPVAGLAPALDTALNACITRWAQLGHAVPAAVASRRVPDAPAGGIPLFTLSGSAAPSTPAETVQMAGIPRFDLPVGAVRTPPGADPHAVPLAASPVAPMTVPEPRTVGRWLLLAHDDTAYVQARTMVEGQGYFGFYCNAPSPVGADPAAVNAYVPVVSAPGSVLIEASGDLVYLPYGFADRAGMQVSHRGVTYDLPVMRYDEEHGGWSAEVPFAHPLVAALRTAGAEGFTVTTSDGRRQDQPTEGLAELLTDVVTTCASAWDLVGSAVPQANAAGSAPASAGKPGVAQTPEAPFAPAEVVAATTIAQLPPVIPEFVQEMCSGQARIDDSALRQAGDLDGDGAPDYIIHYTDVYCQPGDIRGFCGAANCSIDVFMSSRGYTRPFEFLAIDVIPAQAPDGRPGLQMFATNFMCADGACDGVWTWDGQTLRND